jgi:D-sedoheptulose 7-phosphate isomerase
VNRGSGERADQQSIAATIRSRILTSSEVMRTFAEDVDDVVAVADRLVAAFRGGHKLLLFGNGGSAADAQHIAAELVGRFAFDRPPLPAIALTVDTSALTAIGNDMSFDIVFARQVDALGQPGDVAIGLTTSGNSRNVVAGLEAARAKGLLTVAMTGRSGGRAAAFAELSVRVPSDETPRIQESHILVGHIWSEIIEAAIFPRPT